MSNPLVAERHDSTTWHTGIALVDDIATIKSGVDSGSWLEGGLGVVGAGLDLVSAAMDPLGTLLQYGVAWLIEHVKPLRDALNQLAGDADQIAAYAATWNNVAKAVGKIAEDLTREIKNGTAGWTGPAGNAYRGAALGKSAHIKAVAGAAETIGTVTQIAGALVGTVRGLVRDFIASCVGKLISWALEEVGSVGLATPVVVAQATSAIANWVAKIGNMLKKLTGSLRRLGGLIDKLKVLFPGIKKGLGGLRKEAGKAHGEPHPSERPHQSGGAGSRPHDDGSVRSLLRNEKWAEDAYGSIRGANDVEDVARHAGDVKRLDGSTGFSQDEIAKIKRHVFEAEHRLDNYGGGVTVSRFDPSPDMAEAWLRLRAGRANPSDVALLEHELAEAKYWDAHPNATYSEAHAAANKVSDWSRQIPPPGTEDYNAPWR